MENTLVRSKPCAECGAEVLWTQNAWKSGSTGSAAYRCVNGHVIDPTQTRQCPNCGVHDTERCALYVPALTCRHARRCAGILAALGAARRGLRKILPKRCEPSKGPNTFRD